MMNKAAASAILGALLAASNVAAKSPELNPETFATALVSKNIFAKFYAPWCGHCKSLAPDWDALADQYSGSSVLVGSVDCTTDENKDSLCQKYGVQGYPTLKYFVDGSDEGLDYSGARSLEALQSFADETLSKKCAVGSEEEMAKEESMCSDKEKEYARKMRAKTEEERKAQIERLQKMSGGSMKPELKSWIFQRLHVLDGLTSGGGAGASDEF